MKELSGLRKTQCPVYARHSVRFTQDTVSDLNRTRCPVKPGISVRNRRNTQSDKAIL